MAVIRASLLVWGFLALATCSPTPPVEQTLPFVPQLPAASRTSPQHSKKAPPNQEEIIKKIMEGSIPLPDAKYPDSISSNFLKSLKDDSFSVLGGDFSHAFDNSSLPSDLDVQNILQGLRSDPRVDMTVPELVRFYGYGCDIHQVTTKDGYILHLHRVTAKKGGHNCAQGGAKRGSCRPVLLQHGLLGSSSAWVMNYPHKALAYILVDLGYDVWLGNARGSEYSIGHTSLDTSSYAYWDFSFDKMGNFDLPAVIDYILSKSSYPQIHYVGHSMGTTMFWVLENYHPGFAKEKVSSMSALGPVARVSSGTSPIQLIAPFNREMDWMLRSVMDIYSLASPNTWLTKILQKACNFGSLTDIICANMLFLVVGFDGRDLDYSWFPVIVKQLDGGASTKTLVHFGQEMFDGGFRDFNYHWGNYGKYNEFSPPVYDLGKVSVPVQLIYGANDLLADPLDVAWLDSRLTNCAAKVLIKVANPLFNHLDFLWGKDAARLVYSHVIDFMKQYE